MADAPCAIGGMRAPSIERGVPPASTDSRCVDISSGAPYCCYVKLDRLSLLIVKCFGSVYVGLGHIKQGLEGPDLHAGYV